MLDRDWIAAHIPHRHRMCLLDAVLDWSATTIRCRAGDHRTPDHPLRADGRLGAATAIEYAAQAMAVHGALLAPTTGEPTQGYLASVRDAALHVERLDDLSGDLEIEAERISGDTAVVLYRFAVRHAGQTIAEGRAAVILDAGRGSPGQASTDR